MKRLLLFFMITSVNLHFIRAEVFLHQPHVHIDKQIPVLEIPDEQELNEDDQDLLNATVAVEPPLYMRWLMKIGSETAAHIIRLHRALVAQYKKAGTWWAGS